MCISHCQDMALVQCIQSKEELMLYTQVYTFKSLLFSYLHCVCTVTDEQKFCLYTKDSVWKSAYHLVQGFYVSSSVAMLYEFGAPVFFILGPFAEAVRSVTLGVRQSSFYVSFLRASYLSAIESLWSVVLQKFTVTCSYPPCCCWKESIPLPNHCHCSHS